MTNKERQKKLDELKYLKSEKSNNDLSGNMEYCKLCKCAKFENNNMVCIATQKEREDNFLCAKAYNKMIRK